MSVNRVILVGKLGKAPELRATAGGTEVANFSIATNEKHTSKEGTKEVTTWHDVVAWGRLGVVCAQSLIKGSNVYVEGTLQKRKYVNKNNQEVTQVEVRADVVQFLDRAPKNDNVPF